jgi:hypothetical protein
LPVSAFAAERFTKMQVQTDFIARPDLHWLSAPMIEPLYFFIAIVAATPQPRSCRSVANLSLRTSSSVSKNDAPNR